jgi:hypothetical protein
MQFYKVSNKYNEKIKVLQNVFEIILSGRIATPCTSCRIMHVQVYNILSISA